MALKKIYYVWNKIQLKSLSVMKLKVKFQVEQINKETKTIKEIKGKWKNK